MIDENGYRLNVGIVLCNHNNRLFWGKRIGQDAWQFPQGGMNDYESSEQTLARELFEETGLQMKQVEIIADIPEWLHYDLPENYVRRYKRPVCIGQKQRWYLLRLLAEDHQVCLNSTEIPEFEDWCWTNYWRPMHEVVFFKREVYRRVLTEFAPVLGYTLSQENS